MRSIYHILHKIPAIYPEDMLQEYEDLSQELFLSGLIRIDTGIYRNFVTFSDSNYNLKKVFSIEEIENSKLLNRTRETLINLYRKRKIILDENQLVKIFSKLHDQIAKIIAPREEVKIQLIRILVQSAHPIVIRWLLLDKVEIFITYGYAIGDVMTISDWVISGSNSGMQSTDGKNVCVYVSCGGDPLVVNDAQNRFYGDGWPAVARMQIIAGQEVGHFADIIRDYDGRQISRHSAEFHCAKAKPKVKYARRNDITRTQNLIHALLHAGGLNQMIDIEKQIKFFEKVNIRNVQLLLLRIKYYYYKKRLIIYSNRNNILFVHKFLRYKYIAITLNAMIEDMLTHLMPQADVYKRANPEEEEAISCIEALARVPQQVNKWGHMVTMSTMYELYQIYYGDVIPDLIDKYNHITKTNYRRNYQKYKISFWQKIKNFFNKKHKIKLVPVHDVQ